MAQADADRNLLFGILALQMDFISRDVLVAAMHAWVLDKAKPLGLILREQGALAVDVHALLDALVLKHLETHGGDPHQSLAAVGAIGSTLKDLERISDPEVTASLPRIGSTRFGVHDLYATRPPTLGSSSSAGTRFTILRPHAKGGLGQVSVARDEELHREVALKEIQDRHADDPDSRSRFLVEAEITGGLEHPGIVPVYGLGQYGDGRPFYAMRFIRGSSLHDEIKRFHRAENNDRDPGERAVGLQKLLRRFLDVCNAMEYAHSRGVLHRDLKPGNIMVGKYGETLVVDWGLAKALYRPDLGAEAEEPPLNPASSLGTSETLPGSALGTPQYMSPEQASGRLDLLGPGSDVYSLGATLYELVTGRAPFEAAVEVGVVLQRVQRGDFPPPRRLNPKISPRLDAVCVKAMALRPQDRYQSPRALADDIEHWLADEPVSAWREPWTARVRRWASRHRTAVTATAASALVALAALTYLVHDARLRAARRWIEANGRVDALLTAQVRAVPAVLEQLGTDRQLVRDRLRRMARGDGAASAGHRLPAALALLPDDPAQAEFLGSRLLDPLATPDEILIVRDALIGHRAAGPVAPRCRRALPVKAIELSDAELRAAGALAGMVPVDPLWSTLAGPIARKLSRENPLYLGAWREVFRPVASSLTGPLRRIYADRADPEARSRAFTLLFEFVTAPENNGQPDDLAAMVGDTDPDHFAAILARLDTPALRDRALAVLSPQVREPARFDDALARRQGRIAMALLRLGRAEAVWPLLRHRDDPSLRTELINNLARFGLDPSPIVARFRDEPDVSARRASILCLGQFPAEAVPGHIELTAQFLAGYRTDPDPGVHGAIDWLLRRRWGHAADLERIDKELAEQAPPQGRGWYVNGQGQTYTVFPGPVDFRMGSTKESDPDRDEDERSHPRRIDRPFAISTREVTLAEYGRFLDEKPDGVADARENPQFAHRIPSSDCAMGAVTWFEAAQYCNWLSAKERLPQDQWCYPREIRSGMKLPVDHLKRTGYRLPTEAEWEYACRAGAVSARPYGGSEEWLSDYGWYASNSGLTMHPAGSKEPNDSGLFDMLGNAYEWCEDPYQEYTKPRNETPSNADADDSENAARVLRGGTFASTATNLRAAVRNRIRPTDRGTFYGFRPARTYP